MLHEALTMSKTSGGTDDVFVANTRAGSDHACFRSTKSDEHALDEQKCCSEKDVKTTYGGVGGRKLAIPAKG